MSLGAKVVASSSASGLAAGPSPTPITLPGGIVAGDLIVLVVAYTGADQVVSGYTAGDVKTGTNNKVAFFWKIANAADAGAVALIAHTGPEAAALVIRNARATTPVSTAASKQSTAATSISSAMPSASGAVGSSFYLTAFSSFSITARLALPAYVERHVERIGEARKLIVCTARLAPGADSVTNGPTPHAVATSSAAVNCFVVAVAVHGVIAAAPAPLPPGAISL